MLGSRTAVRPVIEDMSRIHAERGLIIDVDCLRDLAFRDERQDLEEMAGNLIDNACKWANACVAVSARGNGAAQFDQARGRLGMTGFSLFHHSREPKTELRDSRSGGG